MHKQTSIIPGSEEHRRLVTGSKVAAILGISPYLSPATAWLRMNGAIPGPDVTEAMRRGTNQESSILDWFFTELHPDIEPVAGETTWTRPDIPWGAANTDAHGTEDGHTVFIEAKSIARDASGEWGKPGTDQIPLHYYVQVLWQMHMTHGPGGDNVTRTYLVKHGPWIDQYDVYVIEYNPVMAMNIERRCAAFHATLADPDGCPAPSDMKGEHLIFASLHPEIERDLEWEIHPDLAAEYIRARDDKAEAEKRESGAKARILKAMGTARTAVCSGVTIGYRRPTKNTIALYPPQRKPHLEDILPAADAA